MAIFMVALINSPAISNTKKINIVDHASKKAQLQETKEELEKLQRNISNKIDKKNKLLIDIRKIEKKIASLNNNYELLLKEKIFLTDSLLQLEKSLQENNKKKNKQEKLILELVKQLHRVGDQQDLQIIFEQGSPESIDRELNYLIHIKKAYQKEIDIFKLLIQRDEELKKDVKFQKRKIQENQNLILTEKNNLNIQHKKRLDLLTIIEREIKSKEEKIKSLKDEKNELNNLLSSIEKIISKSPSYNTIAESFETNMIKNSKLFQELKGTFPWPLKGKKENKFGDIKQETGNKLKGIFISADIGSEVKAIFSGRVIFSDWLKGQGLLIIIDHGNGYMSLYGQNRNLLKTTGSWVEAGEIISYAGNSGGKKTNGLYFELRKDGVPINPSIWCSTQI